MEEALGRRGRSPRRRLLGRIFLGLSFALAAAVGSYTALWFFQSPDIPDVRRLEDHQPSIITRLEARSGDVIGEFAQERRIVVASGDIPRSLTNAIVAVEDADFYHHHGINLRGIARAFIENLKAGRVVEGGSSLTQQLAKLMFLTPERSYSRKIKEALVALHIEKTYSKEEILGFYCNQVYFGHNRYGVEAASRFFFGKHVQDLTLEEAALLAGLPQRPNGYSPYRDPEAAIQRRNHVLDRMAAENLVPPAEVEAAKKRPLALREMETDGPQIGSYFVEEVRQYLEQNYGEKRLYHDGLVVRTTLDLGLQKAAEEALASGLLALDKRQGWRGPAHNVLTAAPGTSLETWEDPSWEAPARPGELRRGLVMAVEGERATVRIGSGRGAVGAVPAWIRRRRISDIYRPGDIGFFRVQSVSPDGLGLGLEIEQEPEVEGALVALEVRTGRVLAMVGGWDFRESKFNRAVQAWRQTGSAFKPILYASALGNGFTAADSLFDEPISITDPWSGQVYSPENYNKTYYGLTTLREALEKSRNPVSVQLLMRVGPQTVIALARRLGISAKLDPYPSLALGSFEDTLLEMTTAMSAFADQGTMHDPFLIERIEDRKGAALFERRPVGRPAIPPEVAYVTNYLMQGVVESGTAAEARHLGRPLAGKTGTTDDFTDAWFIGFSPSIACGVWVGFDVKQSLGKGEVGAKAALPIWIDFMSAALEGTAAEEFTRPPGIEFVVIDKETGLRASDGCAKPFPEAFLRGTAPVTQCTARDHEVRALPYYLQKIYLEGGTVPSMPGEIAPAAQPAPDETD